MRRVATLAVISAACLSCGCKAALTDVQAACIKVAPIFTQVQVYIADGDIALNQVEALEILVPESARPELVAAVDLARTSLRTAAATVQTLTDACQALEPTTLFGDFAKNWTSIQELLAKANAGGGLKAAKPLHVQPPIIVAKIKK